MTNPPRKPAGTSAKSVGGGAGKTTPPAATSPGSLRAVPASPNEAPPSGTAQLHADIDRTREQLSETVAALAHKADVPAQVKAKAHQVTETVQTKAEEMTQQVTDQAKGLIDQAVTTLPPPVRDRAEQVIAIVRQRPVPTAVTVVLGVLILRRLLRRPKKV
jgi:crotonobetainyl-CoA:carnitine CoA-transferase CaiB-like acyl-CoA transferase